MIDRKISACIDNRLDCSLDMLRRYLRHASISAQGRGIGETSEFVSQLFRKSGLSVKVCKAGGHPVVFAERKVSPKAKTILFYNHYDVQPPEPLNEWLSPPFQMTIRQGKIFARGVADNKANLIARISAVRAMMETVGDLPVNVKFVVEGEEEIGSPTLPLFFKKYRELLDADLCLWESSSKDEAGRPQIYLGCKGMIHGELIVRTSRHDLHSSRATIVPSAAWRLIWALATIKDERERILIKDFYKDIVKPSASVLELIKKIPFVTKNLKKELGLKEFLNGIHGFDLLKRHLFEPTFNVAGITTGYQGSGHKTVLPKIARAKFDIRLVPNMSPKDVVAKLRKHLDRHGFGDVEIYDIRSYPAARTPHTHPYVGMAAGISRELWGMEPIVHPTTAASGPMYLFTEIAPCVSAGGVGHPQSNAHAPNESVYLKDYVDGTKYIAMLIDRLSGE